MKITFQYFSTYRLSSPGDGGSMFLLNVTISQTKWQHIPEDSNIQITNIQITVEVFPVHNLTPNIYRTFRNILTIQSPAVTMHTTCFIMPKLCILPTDCVCVFLMVLTIKSDYFLGLCSGEVMCLTSVT
jgi:hypothetical protein